ncbi:MAG: hypothetical protein ABUS57_18795 [Pseudomonadota bacterium]
MEFLTWLEETPTSQWLVESTWAYYSMLALHAIGMAAVVGGTIMLCLRVLGFSSSMALADLERLRLIAWGGFFINALSGSILFAANGVKLAANSMFQLKIASIILGGVALWALWRAIGPHKEPGHRYNATTKAIAWGTLFFWILAIVAGRYIAYTMTL